MFTKPKRDIDRVFLHCSASSRPEHGDIEIIRDWHKRRGWNDVGYHFFIPFGGELQVGRNIEKYISCKIILTQGYLPTPVP